MRIKKIEMDGAEYTIAPLTVEQVEEWLGKSVEVRTEIFGKLFPAGLYDLVCAGLNNALPADAERWTRDSLRARLDIESIERLQEEVMAFSRMRLVKPGEAPAAA